MFRYIKTIESDNTDQCELFSSVCHQMQFLSSQHMKVRKEQPWHLLQLEHISPSAQVPYLKFDRFKSIQEVSVGPVLSPPIFPTAHFSWTSQANLVAAMVFGPVIGTLLHSGPGGLVDTGLGQRAAVDAVKDQQRNKENCRENHCYINAV